MKGDLKSWFNRCGSRIDNYFSKIAYGIKKRGITQAINWVVSPPLHVAIIGTPVAALFLVWAFTLAEPNHPAVYLSYVFSAYMFVVVCVRITRSDPLHAIRRIAYQSTHVARYLDNRDYRAIKGAQLAFVVDTFWALANLAFGVFFGAVWYVTLAACSSFACIDACGIDVSYSRR